MRFVRYDEYRTEAIKSGKLIVYPDFRDSIWFQKVVAGIDDTQ